MIEKSSTFLLRLALNGAGLVFGINFTIKKLLDMVSHLRDFISTYLWLISHAKNGECLHFDSRGDFFWSKYSKREAKKIPSEIAPKIIAEI